MRCVSKTDGKIEDSHCEWRVAEGRESRPSTEANTRAFFRVCSQLIGSDGAVCDCVERQEWALAVCQ